MIPCYICGKDIGGGWSIGFPPAPDSEKMGLCRGHDTASHREQVQKAWQELIYKRLAANNENAAYRAGDIPQLISIYFSGGGAVSLPCSSFSVVDGKTLKIITPGGESIFFPLGQVRNYALSPLEPLKEETREAPEKAQSQTAPAVGSALALPETEPGDALPPEPESKADDAAEFAEEDTKAQKEGGD